MKIIDNIARETITMGGYAEYGYWQYNEPLIWIWSEGWRGINNCRLSDIVLERNNVFNIEPSLKCPSLNAFLLSVGQSRGHDIQVDVIKVGATIGVTKDGHELIGRVPAETLQIVG